MGNRKTRVNKSLGIFINSEGVFEDKYGRTFETDEDEHIKLRNNKKCRTVSYLALKVK